MNGNLLPFLVFNKGVFSIQKSFSRIVNQISQTKLFFLRKKMGKYFRNLIANYTGSRPHKKNKGFTFSVKVGKKILRSLGKGANCFQVDYLRRCLIRSGKGFCQQTKIIQVFFHNFSPLFYEIFSNYFSVYKPSLFNLFYSYASIVYFHFNIFSKR